MSILSSLRLGALSFVAALVLAACGGSSDPSPSATPTSVDGDTGESLKTVLASTSDTTADGWTYCAAEGATCSFSGTRIVRYGAGTKVVDKQATASVACDNGTFGDPIVGTVKSCWIQSDASLAAAAAAAGTAAILSGDSTTVTWTTCASEGGSCTVSGTQQVRYGIAGKYVVQAKTGSFACSNATFGDPAVGYGKTCAVASVPEWTACASEGGTCTFTGTRNVRYGTAATNVVKAITTSTACTNAVFGDPLMGTVKQCWYSGALVASQTPPTSSPGTTTPVATTPTAPVTTTPVASTPVTTTPGTTSPSTGSPSTTTPAPVATPTLLDATRLANQATFGSSEALVAEIRSTGVAPWIANQMKLATSSYTAGGASDVHKVTVGGSYCDLPGKASDTCWRDNMSTEPLLWDFYRNAVSQPDQLRQRVAFALQQIVVVSGLEVEGTYGFRRFYNTLLGQSFGNYRQVLRLAALSPVMGDYLNNANNDKAAPNENFGRELLQLFSIGTCELNSDASLKSGTCIATYDNQMVRNYAYALTGWTYPAGGATPWGCWPAGSNCRYYDGDMVPFAALHDLNSRQLLSGVTVPASSSASVALEKVLDSLMAHPNLAPRIGRELIKHLVMSNPSPAYIARVAAAFSSGRYVSGSTTFGAGQPGDLAATVAAVLLDSDARQDVSARSAGKLREPALLFTGVLRALGGQTDGGPFGFWWGTDLRQQIFRPPSVFNYYPPDFPVAGSALVGPEFALHNASAAFSRMNVLVHLIDWGGMAADASVVGATGTKLNLDTFLADALDAAKLVDRMSNLALGQPLANPARAKVVDAVSAFTAQTMGNGWQDRRVKTAAYLLFASPQFQVQR